MLTMTQTAESRIEELITTNAKKKDLSKTDLFLRVYIAGSGPQGLQHGMALTTERRDDDLDFATKNGIVVLVDRMSQDYLKGAEIDFVKHELGSNFKINNPNQVAAAGCGSCSGDAGCC